MPVLHACGPAGLFLHFSPLLIHPAIVRSDVPNHAPFMISCQAMMGRVVLRGCLQEVRGLSRTRFHRHAGVELQDLGLGLRF